MCEFDFFSGLICGVSSLALFFLVSNAVRNVRFHKKDL